MNPPVRLVSYSIKHGNPPKGWTRIIDCRVLRNPHNVAVLRDLTGKDPSVQAYVMSDQRFAATLNYALSSAEPGAVLAFGCFGGRHRSVAMAEMTANALADRGVDAVVEHRALGKN